MFKGYVETKNKKSIEKLKGRTDFKTHRMVKNLPEYAGVLSDDVILIDIDDQEQSDILFNIVTKEKLKCRVYGTTRGKHFLFKNHTVKSNKTKCSLAVGLTADIKLGTRYSYEVLKFDNKDRPILYDEQPYQEVPKFLTPIKNVPDFNLEQGDGRNQKLFNYILTLQSNDFSKEEAKTTLRIINDYILKDPLSSKELETLSRDEAFQKPAFFNGTVFLFDKFSTFLKNEHHIKKINSQLNIYKDGIYVPGNKNIEAEMIKIIPNLNKTKRNEVLAYLDILINEDINYSDENYIGFKNGVYDISDSTFKDFSPEYIIQNKIPWDYNPVAYNELTDKTLDKLSLNDKEIRSLLEELIGYCFFRRNELRMTFMLVGDKKNGKSTFLGMIANLLGRNNISSLDLSELGQRFKTAEIYGKLANIGDDIGEEFIPDTALFKKIATGDRINAERKGQDPFEFNPYSKLIFSANNPPRIKDKTGAVSSRLIMIPFNNVFTKEDPDYDPLIKKKLSTKESMEYLIQIGIKALHRILETKTFTHSVKSENELKQYEALNNPIIGFLDEHEVINENTDDVYRKYTIYCTENNLGTMGKIEFVRQVNKRCNLKSDLIRLNGKRIKIFKSVTDVS